MENNYTVYIHKNIVNGKCYVGLTRQNCEERWRMGKGYKTQIKFYRAIQKYGWDKFEHLIVATNLTEIEASQLEQELIQKYDSCNNGYNVDLGGSTTNHSPETIEKIRQKNIGRKCSEETKQKISESSIHFAVICIETGITYPSLAEAERQTGIDKASIGKCCRGIMYKAGSYTWRYADKAKREQYSNITNTRVNKAKKPVRCLTTGKIYDTVREAAKDTNSDESNIIKVCKGKYKTTNGLKWEYYTPQLEVYGQTDE